MTTLTQDHTFSRTLIKVVAGSMLLALSAQLSLPLLPIPVTFQTMALLVLAIFFGPRLAAFAALAYLAEGAAGLPVFANWTGGAHILVSVVGGYLLALPAAAWIAGFIAQKRSFGRILLAGLSSSLLILAVGSLFLSYFVGFHLAFNLGFKPFILIEIIKVLAVAGGFSLSNNFSKKTL